MKRPLFAICLTIVLGVILYLQLFPVTITASYGGVAGKEVCLSGQVYSKEYQKGPAGPVLVLFLKPEELRFQNQKIPFYNNFICVLQEEKDAPCIGSEVLLTGILYEYEAATNPGQFDAAQYYNILGFSAKITGCRIEHIEGEGNWLKEKLWQLRCRLGAVIDETFREDAAAFLRSMLLGDRTMLDVTDKKVYREAGMLHILAISGLHISFLGMGLYKVLRKMYLPVLPAAVLSGICMLLFGIMVGMPVSALRAISMFLLRLLAECTGRTYDMPTALAVCGAGILLENPLYLYHAGFWLSFCAVAGVCIAKPVLVRTDKAPGRFEDAFLTSLAVSFFTIPFQLYFYYEIPVYAILWNLVVIPLAGLCMCVGALTVAFAMCRPFFSWLTQITALCANGIVLFYETGSGVVSQLPGNLWRTGKPEEWQLVSYAGIVCMVFLLKKLAPRYKFGLLCGAVLLLAVEIRTEAEITFLDVGQGDCICIQLPDGSNWLCDGGSSDVSKVGEYRIEPYLKHEGIKVLDAVFLSHGDSDHTNGVLELLQRNSVEIKLLVLPVGDTDMSNGSEFREILYLAKEKEIPVLWLQAGMQWRTGEVWATCLHPVKGGASEDGNASSEVLYLAYKGVSLLLTGDVGISEEPAILKEMAEKGIEKVTILKVPHHGSRYSCSEEFLAQMHPDLSVISCGENNPYGHPHEETVERLLESGSLILTTPECGAVTVVIGEEILIEKWIPD